MTIKINIDDAFNVTFVNRPTHHNGFRILYADSKTAQFLGNGEPCDHHKHCGEAAILESNNEDLLCQDHAEEYRPCDSCDIHVRAGEQNGYGEDYLCPDCFVPATSPEDIEHAMSLDPHAVRGCPGWTDPNIPELSEEMCAMYLRELGFTVVKTEGFELDGEECQKMEEDEQRLEQMYIHDWLIFTDNPLGCRIAIHKTMVNPGLGAEVPDCSSPDPDDDITRFGPGSLSMSMTSIDDLHMDVHHVHTLWDEGYLNDNCILIFKQGGAS